MKKFLLSTYLKKYETLFYKQGLVLVLAVLFGGLLQAQAPTSTSLFFEPVDYSTPQTASIETFPEIIGSYTVELYLSWDQDNDPTGYPCVWQFAKGFSSYPTSLWIQNGYIEFWDPSYLTGSSSPIIEPCTWYHVAYVWDGTTGKIFVDGQEVATHTGRTYVPGNDQFILGNDVGNWPFSGQVDELRISSTARYTANFSAPNGELPLDVNTLALYHFDEASGQTAADASSNGLDLTLGSSPGIDINDPAFTDPATVTCGSVTTTCTDVTASITTDCYSNETTWELTESSTAEPYSGGPYEASYTTYSEVLCLEPGCYVLDAFDSFGDGGGAVEVLIDGYSVAGGSIYGDGSAFPFCVPAGEGCVNVTINTTTDYFNTETTWEVNPDVEPIATGGPYSEQNSTTINEGFCLDPGCYSFTVFDSFGDGIYYPGGVSIVVNGVEVAGGSVEGDETTFTFCISDDVCNDGANDPELSACPENITECGAQSIYWTAPTATDADGCAEPVVTVDPDVASGDFFGVGTTTITYTATDGAGGMDECSFTVTINLLPEVEIQQSNLSEWCQGVKVLYAKIGNSGNLTYPVTFQWSDGLGNNQEVTALANGTYSVTVTEGNGCETITSTVVNEDLTTLISAHTIVSGEDLDMSKSTVLSGGVGVLDAGEVTVKTNSDITTFLRASGAYIDGSSNVVDYTNSDSPLGLPAFMSNPHNDNNDVNVPSGGSVTLSGSNYGNVKLGKNATLYIATGTIYMRSLTIGTASTIIFLQPTDVMVKQKVRIGMMCTVNVEGPTVVIYSGDNASVGQGSTVAAHIYSAEGLEVGDSGSFLTTYMSGMFIGMDEVESDDNVVWNWNLNCSQEEQTPELAQQGGIAQNIENNADKLTDLTLYPNPTSGVVNISADKYIGKSVQINIYNALGTVVWTKNIQELDTAIIPVDMGNNRFPAGIYHMSFTADGERISKQIVLTK